MFRLLSTGILLFAAISWVTANHHHQRSLNDSPNFGNDRNELSQSDNVDMFKTKENISNNNNDRTFAIIDGEEILLPRKLPKISWKEKEAILLSNGLNKTEIAQLRQRRRHRVSRKTTSKKRRSLHDSVWRRERVVGPAKPQGPPVSADLQYCPPKIDAVTQAHNLRTYVFSNEYVHQIYRDQDGLQQKSSYLITDMFPAGPRTVSAAFTNLRSAVTVLISRDTVFRFRWSKKAQRFYLARKSPQKLDRNITFTPQFAFQWSDGNMILSDGFHFTTYDPYWNVATFSGYTSDYFPDLPRNAVGLVYSSKETYLWLNERANVIVYNMKKFRVVQEYPVRISDYIACLSKRKA
jgi:hypothetical protein